MELPLLHDMAPVLPIASFAASGLPSAERVALGVCWNQVRATNEINRTVCRGKLELTRLPETGAYAYLDVIYQNHAGRRGKIAYRCADFQTTGRVLEHRRSHSLAIPLAALRKEPTVHFAADVPFEIEATTVRADYYDYFGLHSRSADPNGWAAELGRSRRAAAAIPSSVQWFITWKCNFACAYCWQEVSSELYRAGRANRIPPERWAAGIQRLEPRELYLTGGEPTLYRQLPEFIGLLSPEIELEMTSNFGPSFSVDRFLEHVAPERFRELVLSLHPTQVDPAIFFAKLDRLHAAGYRGLAVEMVMYPKNIPFAQDALERCRELGISLCFDPYVPAAHDPVGRDGNLMAEMRKWVDAAAAHTRELSVLRSRNFDLPQIWEVRGQAAVAGRAPIFCPAGSRRINVDELGDAFCCMSAVDRSKLFDRLALPHYAPIGNIFASDFQMLEQPILCWESFRCSSCDVIALNSAWTVAPGATTPPLPE
jgi:MoaA/NifB/PqqE/SkfB family radical SAM enzyme